MDKTAGQISADQPLFPAVEPFDRRLMETPDGHQIYVEQCGKRGGVPVVVLHGGPGGGCSPIMRRFFDPEVFHVTLFDQRGCGRSKPHASVENNTTWHLVSDIEAIREMIGIDRWAVFGGSWGATLALAYAQRHPARVDHLFLRGVFLARQEELDWFYGGGAGRFWPELWDRFTSLVPAEEQDDFIAAYHRRIFGDDAAVALQHARVWTAWENALAAIGNNGVAHDMPADYARAFARLETHYFVNNAFMEEGQLLRDIEKIAHVPGIIVQGRHDMICPPTSAYALAKVWEKAELRMIPAAGHALSEPGITAALAEAVRAYAQARR